MKLIWSVFLLCIFFDAYAQEATRTKNPYDEIYVDFEAEYPGKAPMRYYNLNLKIKNNSKENAWYIFPWNVRGLLPETGRFEASKTYTEYDDPLSVRRFKDSTGAYTTAIEWAGISSFTAFYVTAGSTLDLKGYVHKIWSDSEVLVCVKAKKLYVNDKQRVSDFLPYTLHKGRKTTVQSAYMDYEDLTRDPETYKPRADFPTTRIYSMMLKQADQLFQWEVPIKGK